MAKAEENGAPPQEMKIWTTEVKNKETGEENAHSFEEALTIVGNGGYSIGLLAIAGLSMLGTGMDMFGLAVVAVGASCDLNIDQQQMSILLATPFAGAILMAYPWGYISDTKGRKICLQVAMIVSFVASVISIFSTNWIMMAVLKIISSGFSSCSQSVSYALMGESVGEHVRGIYVQMVTSILMLTPTFYYILGYWILNFSFSYNLGFIYFTPWRLLVMVLCLPLGISAVSLTFYYESPKFLLNNDQEEKALEILEIIWRRNNRVSKDSYFPVKKIVLIEEGNVKKGEVSFLKSLWDQIAPLFMPPFLKHSIKLYYIICTIFFVNNSLTMWFPFLSDSFFGRQESAPDQPEGMCQMINAHNNVTKEEVLCSPTLDLNAALTTAAISTSVAVLSIILSKFASRKKMATIILLVLSSSAGVSVSIVNNNVAGFTSLILFLTSVLCIGFVVAFIIELFPTSYRGMASCLYVMTARGGGLLGTYLVGKFMLTDCDTTMYFCSAYLISAAVVACFLPPDKPKKQV